jgi:hypothetical protein
MSARDERSKITLTLSEKIKRKIKNDKEMVKKKKVPKVVKFYPSNRTSMKTIITNQTMQKKTPSSIKSQKISKKIDPIDNCSEFSIVKGNESSKSSNDINDVPEIIKWWMQQPQ